MAGCGGESEGTDTTTSASSSTTYDDEYAYAEAKKVDAKFQAHDGSKPLPTDTEWATDSFIKGYNEEVQAQNDAGVVEKGKVTITGTHPAESRPDAPGGWDLTMYQCSVSTIRYFKDGVDVTVRQEDPSEPLPKGPHDNVHLLSFTSPDDGKTWQLDESQYLYGDRAEEAPCDE
ncbi:hypothetical protein [Janibacter anophelis]|uniref:hypothetical protein n=1 Tax=Janibacter anophelis TaxID=319054 RepID=UPI0039EF283B